jgi:hypothetical protein
MGNIPMGFMLCNKVITPFEVKLINQKESRKTP